MNKLWLTAALGVVSTVAIGVLWWHDQEIVETTGKNTVEKSNIGVPWDVERAMMGGAHENDIYFPHDVTIQSETTRKFIEPDSPPKMNLDSEQLLQQLNAK